MIAIQEQEDLERAMEEVAIKGEEEKTEWFSRLD